jgi:hypothetical protein
LNLVQKRKLDKQTIKPTEWDYDEEATIMKVWKKRHAMKVTMKESANHLLARAEVLLLVVKEPLHYFNK